MPIPLIPANQPRNENLSLKEALGLFRQTVQESTLQRALKEAEVKVKEVSQAGMKEQDRINAMNDVARQLTFRMIGVGANPAQVAQAAGQVGLPPVQSGVDAITRGVMANDADMTQRGVMIEKLTNQGRMELMEQRMAGLRGGRPLTTAELDKISKVDEVESNLTAMVEKLDSDPSLSGPLAARVPGRGIVSEDFATFQQMSRQFFDAYRVAVTGAGASPGELKILEKSIPQITDRPEVFKAKAAQYLKQSRKIRERYIQRLGQAGRDVSGLSPAEQAEQVEQRGAGAPAWQAYTK